MKKYLKYLMLPLLATLSVTFTACDKDNDPNPPKQEQPEPVPDTPDNPQGGGDNEDIPGSKILGTWYYLSPNKALKATVTFTSEKSINFATFGTRVCYISIESELPYNHDDYKNVWSYSDSQWKITRFAIVPGAAGATISNVFDNELWMDVDFYTCTERIKFSRNNPGNAENASGMEVAPDGIFGKYLWRGSIGKYNITFQFTGADLIHETSDSKVMISDANGNYKYVTENDSEAMYKNGYFHFDFTGILSSVLECSCVVVIQESEKKLVIYTPFNPGVRYYFTRD